MNKLVSIIIRTKNEERWISACLRAGFGQTYNNIEVIIVDNKSSDRTVCRAKEFSVKIISIERFFPGKAINDGVLASSGEYIVCLSAHCIPVNEFWLENLIKDLDMDNVAGVYGRQEPLSFTSDVDKRDLMTVFGLDKKIQVKDSFFHNANSAFRKDVWEKYPFDNELSNIEDRVWGRQVINDAMNIVYEPSASVYHWHGINQDLNPERAKNVVKILESLDNCNSSIGKDLLDASKVVAIIPLRGKSEMLGDKTLLEYTINSAKESKYIHRIIVATDDEESAELAKKLGADVPFLRPKSLSEDYVDKFDVANYILEKIETENNHYDYVVLLEEIYPFREKDVIDKMLKYLVSTRNDTIVAAAAERRGIWLQQDKEAKLLEMENDSFAPSSLKKSKALISLIGLCCVTHPDVVRSKSVLNSKIGLFEINNPLSTITVLKDADKNFSSLILNAWNLSQS